MELAAGKPVFDFFETIPEESQVFNAAMVSITRTCVGAILEAYDFSNIRKTGRCRRRIRVGRRG